MRLWKKKKPKEIDFQEIFDDITQLTNAVKDSALDLAILTRNIEIIEDEWYRYCEFMKKR